MGRSPRSRTVAELKKVPRTPCRRAPYLRRYRGIVAESSPRSGPRRLPAIVQAWFRPTRHPVQTPARRCHGGVTSRRVDAVVSQPRSRPPSPQLDVAGTPGEGLPRRFRDTCIDPALADSTCGAPSGALHRPSIVVSGWGYTAAARRRAVTAAAGRRRAAAADLTPRRRPKSQQPLVAGASSGDATTTIRAGPRVSHARARARSAR